MGCAKLYQWRIQDFWRGGGILDRGCQFGWEAPGQLAQPSVDRNTNKHLLRPLDLPSAVYFEFSIHAISSNGIGT